MANRIRIIGPVGSGKTTLTRKLSEAQGIPMFTLDDMVWSRGPNGDTRNSTEYRDALLKEVIQKESWIIEGTHLGWADVSFEKANLIIFLNPSVSVRIYRFSKRFYRQKRGIDPISYTPTWTIYGRMFKWTYQYETIYKHQVRSIMSEVQAKSIEIQDGKELGVF
ncbi:AAA family ATPase [Paenisporosarcina quisquiliarum]|uniref:AAA family ATPase n=1 Tax=Paenisporosarcina quisquiliarum TaxID=365346 RepID=UPI0037360544